MDKCFLCLRVLPKQVARAIHALPFPKEKRNEVLQESLQLIKKGYDTKPYAFCGKTTYGIISGLLYILSYKYCPRHINQYDITQNLSFMRRPHSELGSSAAVRSSYKVWVEVLPELKELMEEK